MARLKTPIVVKRLSRELRDRIRRAEWVTERKHDAVRDKSREPQRPASALSWSQIVKAMR